MSRLKTRGTGNSQAKLTPAHVYCIRACWMCGLYLREIAALYKISITQTWRIVHKKDWAWL